MGFRIFALCLRQVFINWKVALRLSWFWLLLFFAMVVALAGTIAVEMQADPQNLAGPGLLFLLLLIAFVFIGAVGFSAIAIGWHRWVLRDEEPDRFFVVRQGWPILAYVWRALVIGIIAVLCLLLPFALYTMIFTAAMTGDAADAPVRVGLASTVFGLLLGTLATWIVLRIGLVLPAVAVGEQLTFGESFRQTAPIAGPLAVTALCVTVFQAIPTLLDLLTGGMAGPSSPVLAVVTMAALAVFSWINFFVSFGILTVAYGHTVEGRPI